jgi:hypothetical protein
LCSRAEYPSADTAVSKVVSARPSSERKDGGMKSRTARFILILGVVLVGLPLGLDLVATIAHHGTGFWDENGPGAFLWFEIVLVPLGALLVILGLMWAWIFHSRSRHHVSKKPTAPDSPR